MESIPTENLEKSEHDFTITSSEKRTLVTSQNILTKINIVSQYLADVFYLPSSEWSKKSYKPWIITEGRTITDKAHQELYKEKEEIKARKEEQEKKQETKLPEGKNKIKKKQRIAEWMKAVPSKMSTKSIWTKILTKSERTGVWWKQHWWIW